jgi:haloacetate dehalogenase
MNPLFPDFDSHLIEVNGVKIMARKGGSGQPLLLLHGHPQTHAIWHRVAQQLAKSFTVVMTDLRGYGDSSKPQGTQDHLNYSKRVMALDQIEVMRHFGFAEFDVRPPWPCTKKHPINLRVLIGTGSFSFSRRLCLSA